MEGGRRRGAGGKGKKSITECRGFLSLHLTSEFYICFRTIISSRPVLFAYNTLIAVWQLLTLHIRAAWEICVISMSYTLPTTNTEERKPDITLCMYTAV